MSSNNGKDKSLVMNIMRAPKYRLICGYSLTVVVILFGIVLLTKLYNSTSNTKICPYIWHGGSPTHKGSCWCGNDDYCMCTPSLAIDAIIEYHQHDQADDIYILLVNRRDPPKDLFAIPGGFVNLGETVEMATIREVKEETNLTVAHSEQFKMYSDPSRDKRRHTVSMVFRCIVDSVEHLHTGDDAKSVKFIPIRDILSLDLAFDHRQILSDYLKKFHPHKISGGTDL